MWQKDLNAFVILRLTFMNLVPAR